MKHRFTNTLGGLFLVAGIALLFSVPALADADSGMTFGNALIRLVGAATIAFIGVELLNLKKKGTKA